MSDILNELVGENSKEVLEKKERLQKAEHDFFYFCKTYLPHYFSSEPAPYHKILIDIANTHTLTNEHVENIKSLLKKEYHSLLIPTEKLKAVVDIEPRGFSKSTRWALAYPLWRLLFKKNNFVCIFCATQDMANRALQSIKDEIEGNEIIFEDFGAMEGSIWKSDFLSFKNGTAIKSFGAGAAVRGVKFRQYRPDLIICDDILKDEAARTFSQRQKIYNWFLRAVMPLGQDTFTIIINTIFHSDDLPSRLLKRIENGELENWIGLRFAAFTPQGDSLWSSYWTSEKLETKKKEIGSAAFSTEYMNEPLSDEERVFKPEWFTRFSHVDISSLKVYMGVDPSAGKHDEFAIFTLGIASDGTIYALNEWAECCSVGTAVNKLIEKYLIYKPILIGFEEVGFQSIYKKYIMEKASKKGVYLPIKGCSTKGIGKERILSLSPFIENGMLKFKENMNKTIDQLTMYPKSEFDDLQDALYYAWEISQIGFKEVTAFNLTSGFDRLGAALHGFRRRR
ncbi:hypothetical protein [Treponema phagedenis]|uniref:hypothetical protein n=1 Tax=Treponema phagedenis TaxID=162 RepID=UPI0011E6DDD2|nr:hypothetical protein [Treponema phagedenis]QEK04693.1 hypothetical protein FUT83_13365 [Treponema phagedenis]QEK10351.1 hypothetical protein FUT81_13500 [Treponema phagedenis]